MKILRHIWFVLFLFGCFVPALPSTAAEDGARIVIMAVEDPNNYDAVNSMRSMTSALRLSRRRRRATSASSTQACMRGTATPSAAS